MLNRNEVSARLQYKRNMTAHVYVRADTPQNSSCYKPAYRMQEARCLYGGHLEANRCAICFLKSTSQL